MATKKVELTEETPLFVVDDGIFLRLYTTREFFARIPVKWEAYRIIKLDGEPAIILTKKMIMDDFPYFADTRQYQAIMDRGVQLEEKLRKLPSTVRMRWRDNELNKI